MRLDVGGRAFCLGILFLQEKKERATLLFPFMNTISSYNICSLLFTLQFTELTTEKGCCLHCHFSAGQHSKHLLLKTVTTPPAQQPIRPTCDKHLSVPNKAPTAN